MRALIINGRPDGGENPDRWTSAKIACDSMGWACERSPAVFVGMDDYRVACGDHSNANRHEKYVRGCMFAHRRAFATVAKSEGRAIVLEDDISAPSGTQINKHVQGFLDRNANVDVAYIGHCFGDQCMHAYALTPTAAKKALDHIDWCGKRPVDNQLADMCASKQLSCAYAPNGPVQSGSWGSGLIHQKTGGEVRNTKWFPQ